MVEHSYDYPREETNIWWRIALNLRLDPLFFWSLLEVNNLILSGVYIKGANKTDKLANKQRKVIVVGL